jgi:hypothetical protein
MVWLPNCKLKYRLSHTSSPFCSGYLGDEIPRTICLGWPGTVILISASQVARITDVSHQPTLFSLCDGPIIFVSLSQVNKIL